MALSITTTSSILESKPIRKGEVARLTSQLDDAMASITNPDRFSSRAKLDASGLNRLYDDAQRAILAANGNKISAQVISVKLENENRGLAEFNAALVAFERDMGEMSDHAGTDAEKADRALEKMSLVLRRKDPGGRYIFGGSTPYIDPLSKLDNNGVRVAIDLKASTSLIGGQMSRNYSDTSPNETVVTVSAFHEVKEGFLHPEMDAIYKTIGYINMVKDGQFTANQRDAAQLDARQARGAAAMAIGLEEKKVEASLYVNDSEINSADSKNNYLFSSDLVESTGRMQSLMHSVQANISLDGAKTKIFDNLMDRMRLH
ncbi:MAG: hypothetical protein COA94_05295 [Rickettsiales bacterium]|nr:MAG: hypothetical protein COA94_05295 [Rickettsiales bacterium]